MWCRVCSNKVKFLYFFKSKTKKHKRELKNRHAHEYTKFFVIIIHTANATLDTMAFNERDFPDRSRRSFC